MKNPVENIIIFIGPPGSGKGSLANLCVKDLGWVQLSTGNLCRKHIIEQTEIGKVIDFAIKSGNLVSDSIISDMVAEWLESEIEKHETIILDGFPRTANQAQALDTLLKKFNSIRLSLVRLLIDDEHLVQRLSSRVVCQNKECQAVYSLVPGSLLKPKIDMICDLCGTSLGRRKDDELSTVRERLHVYRMHEKVLLDYYRHEGHSIMELDVEKPLIHVFEDFKKMMGLEVI